MFSCVNGGVNKKTVALNSTGLSGKTIHNKVNLSDEVIKLQKLKPVIGDMGEISNVFT